MKTATLTHDGSPVVSVYKERRMRRRKADVEAHEAKRDHQLTLNGLYAAIRAAETGDNSPATLATLREIAQRAEAAIQ